MTRVTILGSSQPKEGEALYSMAEKLGRLLAESKYDIVNGGYYGTMEAASKGASTVKGAHIEGVITSKVFVERKPGGNEYLTNCIDAPTLLQRLDVLVSSSHAFVVLPGTQGSLTELILAWCISTTTKFNSGGKAAPIVAFRQPWEGVMKGIVQALGIPDKFAALIHYVDTPEEAVQMLGKLL